MAFKFVLFLASVALANAGYIPNDHHSTLAYAPSVSYGNVHKSIIAEPQYHHGYAQAAQSVVISKPLAVANPISYANHHGLYQHPALVKNIQYSSPLSYAPVAKTIIAEPAYAKSFVSEPIYGKSFVAQPAYAKTLVAEPIYGKTIVAQPAYAKTIVAEPEYSYSKNVYAQPIYAGNTLVGEPIYGKSLLAQPASIYGGHDLSYAHNLAYGGVSAHGW